MAASSCLVHPAQEKARKPNASWNTRSAPNIHGRHAARSHRAGTGVGLEAKGYMDEANLFRTM